MYTFWNRETVLIDVVLTSIALTQWHYPSHGHSVHSVPWHRPSSSDVFLWPVTFSVCLSRKSLSQHGMKAEFLPHQSLVSEIVQSKTHFTHAS